MKEEITVSLEEFLKCVLHGKDYRIARKTAANLDAHNLVLRIKLSVGCKRS